MAIAQTALRTMSIDTSPDNIARMMDAGSFQSHQDGKWRYSPYGAECVYVNDPTEQFGEITRFGSGLSAKVCPSHSLFATFYHDGTSGINKWDSERQTLLWQLYASRGEAETNYRAWVKDQFHPH